MKQTFVISQLTSLNQKRNRLESTELSSDIEGSYSKVRANETAKLLFNCNCKNSNCLKMYCECFSKGLVCDSQTCSCQNCYNNEENKNIRQETISKYLKKEISSYRKNIENLFKGKVTQFDIGCTCKKSNCNKNYCECFNKKRPCTNKCKCYGCKNNDCSHKSKEIKDNINIGSEIKEYKKTRVKVIINNYQILED